ncbi:MAG: DegV family protein [Clostridium sp.]
MAIKIVTDSTSYIPEEFINKYDISVVSLNVIMNGESIREVDLDNETFYSKMEESTEIPSSSQPSPDEIYNTFENIIKEGNSIVGIFISSDMSGTVSSANLIKNMLLEKYPTAHIEIVDSRSNCMQMGYVAIEAAKAAAAGKSMEEVIDVCTSVINNSRFLFTPDTLDYLKKGGRIGGASALLGTLFQIKPILSVCDGKTTVFTKVRTKKKAVDTLVTTLVNDLQGKELGGVIVHHINCQDEGLSLAAKIKKQLGVDVQIDTIGPIIGLHVGPGSIGVAYFTK